MKHQGFLNSHGCKQEIFLSDKSGGSEDLLLSGQPVIYVDIAIYLEI